MSTVPRPARIGSSSRCCAHIRGCGVARRFLAALVGVLVSVVVVAVPADASGGRAFRVGFPQGVGAGHGVSVEVTGVLRLRGAGAWLDELESHRWVTRTQGGIGRSGRAVLTFTAPAHAGSLVLRVDVMSRGRLVWRSRSARVRVHVAPVSCPAGQTGTPPNCTTATPTCPAGETGSPPNCTTPTTTTSTTTTPTCPAGETGSPPNCQPAPLSRTSTLSAGQTLASGQALWSTDGQYEAVMQADGNFVVYPAGGAAKWDTQTGTRGSTITMQTDGNLVVYAPGGQQALWSSSTAPSSGDSLVMQTDGNLVVYSSSGAIWDYGSGKLTSGGAGEGQAIVNAARAIQSQSFPEQSFSSAQYIYCFDGGTTIGATAGGYDTLGSDSNYSNCQSIGRIGFDCRGLTLYAVYQGTGGAVTLPTSTAGAQYSDASSYGGSYISLSSLQPGDLVFFGSSSSSIDHVGIVVSGTGTSAEIISAISEKYGIATQTIHWFQNSFSWVGAVAIPGV
jgi:hypothetical protein